MEKNFIQSEDPLIKAGSMPLKSDASSRGRNSTVYSAQSNGRGSLADPLNSSTSPKLTSFRVSFGGDKPVRWNTAGIRIRAVITKYGDHTKNAAVFGGDAGAREGNLALGDAPYDSIDTFALADAIEQVRMNFNDAPVVATLAGRYRPYFMTSLIANHSRQSLETHPALFSPIYDDQLTAMSYRNGHVGAAGTPFDWSSTAAEPARYNDVDCVGGPIAYTPTPTALAAKLLGPQYGSTPSNYINAKNYNLASSENAIARARFWIGSESRRRVVERVIPLADLTNVRAPGVIKNLRNLALDIQWRTTDIMTHFTAKTTDGAQGTENQKGESVWSQFNIIACDLITDEYIATTQTLSEQVEDKVAGDVDRIAFEFIDVMNAPYTTDSAIVVPGKSNMQRVAIYDYAIGQSNGSTEALAVPGTGTKRMDYNAPSHCLWGNNCANAASAASGDENYPWFLRQNDHQDEGYDQNPFTSICIMYNGVQYPQQPITTGVSTEAGLVAFVPNQLYMEYLKATAKADKRDSAPSVDLATFSHSMPFALLKPWSDNGVHISPVGDLTVNITGGQPGMLTIATMRLMVVSINASGAVTVDR